MTPLRALTIAIKAALLDERARETGLASIGLREERAVSRPAIARRALDLAHVALDHLPKGWALVDVDIAELERRIDEADGTTRLLLAFQILRDGHAPTLGEAGRIADDRERVRALYPDSGL